MGIGNRIELLVHRRQNVRVTMTQTGYRRAAGRVDVTRAVAVEQFDAFASYGNRHDGIGGAVQNMGHDAFLLFLGLRCVFKAARCASECRSVASASSPPRPAMTAPRTSATAKAGDMAWKNDGLSVGTITACCAICASGATSLSVIATTVIPCSTAYSASSMVWWVYGITLATSRTSRFVARASASAPVAAMPSIWIERSLTSVST